VAIESPITDSYFTGEDKSLVFTIYQADGTTAQNITGWALSWMVKRNATDADGSALVTKTTAGGGVVLTTPASGVCTVTVEDTDIANIVGGNSYVHELKRTDAGAETVLSYGSLVLGQAVHGS
jgi:hypothetical protein